MSPKSEDNGRDETPADPGRSNAGTVRIIYIRAVVDVDGVLRDTTQKGGSSAGSETPIPARIDDGLLIVTAMPGNADPATGDITVVADTGDTLRFYAVSGSNNFDDAVLIQNAIAVSRGDDPVVEPATLVNLQQAALAPASDGDGLKAAASDQEFWFWQSAAGAGSRNFSFSLALYGRDEDGQPRQAGLYRWDLALTVLPTEPSETDTPTEEKTS